MAKKRKDRPPPDSADTNPAPRPADPLLLPDDTPYVEGRWPNGTSYRTMAWKPADPDPTPQPAETIAELRERIKRWRGIWTGGDKKIYSIMSASDLAALWDAARAIPGAPPPPDMPAPFVHGQHSTDVQEGLAALDILLRWCDGVESELAGGTAVPSDTAGGKKVTWQQAANYLETLRVKGEAFRSQPEYAEDLECSPATVNKAIKNTAFLQEWARRQTSSTSSAVGIDGAVLEGMPQSREADPADMLDDEDVDKAMRHLLEQAGPEERARIHKMSPAERRQLAQMANRDPDFMPSPLE